LNELVEILKIITENAKTQFQKRISKILLKNNSTILDFIKDTINLSKELNLLKNDLVITHSDPYFLNLMKMKNDIYLIDWDGIKLGPKEQDIWFYLIKGICNKPFIFLNSYKKTFGEFKLNKKIIHYYIRSRVLEDFYQYLKEILSGKEDEVYFEEIKDYSLGWILKIEKMFKDVDTIIDNWNELKK
jgi:thiamine kinase-like enzyme